MNLSSFSIIFVFGSELGPGAETRQDFGNRFRRMREHWLQRHSGLKRDVFCQVVRTVSEQRINYNLVIWQLTEVNVLLLVFASLTYQ